MRSESGRGVVWAFERTGLARVFSIRSAKLPTPEGSEVVEDCWAES